MKFKRSKNSRQRGSSSHGWGAKKKHRGAGHRGGRGAAGSGKRGDGKKPSFWTEKKRVGKHGFKSKNKEKIVTINICDLDAKADTLVKQGKAESKNNTYIIDLAKLNVNKLLGKGKTSKKFDIKVKYASELAIARITEAGGKVELAAKPQKEEKQEKPVSESKDSEQ